MLHLSVKIHLNENFNKNTIGLGLAAGFFSRKIGTITIKKKELQLESGEEISYKDSTSRKFRSKKLNGTILAASTVDDRFIKTPTSTKYDRCSSRFRSRRWFC